MGENQFFLGLKIWVQKHEVRDQTSVLLSVIFSNHQTKVIEMVTKVAVIIITFQYWYKICPILAQKTRIFSLFWFEKNKLPIFLCLLLLYYLVITQVFSVTDWYFHAFQLNQCNLLKTLNMYLFLAVNSTR